MSLIAATSSPGFASPNLVFVGMLVIFACGIGGAACLWDYTIDVDAPQRPRTVVLLEREKDIAAGLGWPWERWLGARLAVTLVGLVLGLLSHIILLIVVGPFVGFLGFRFALAGRAAARRLRMERAFLQQLRNLRDRMSVSNQSLDTALQEIGRNPGAELEWVLAPLARGGSVVANIVETGTRSRSPVVEYACGVLLWARTRSLDSLIEAIDEILLPVGEAQLAVQEESLVTLTQQRAVTFAMSALMGFMFVIVVRVEIFAQYYQTFAGNVVLGFVLAIFAGLVFVLGIIVRIGNWTRWDLVKLARQQERLNA